RQQAQPPVGAGRDDGRRIERRRRSGQGMAMLLEQREVWLLEKRADRCLPRRVLKRQLRVLVIHLRDRIGRVLTVVFRGKTEEGERLPPEVHDSTQTEVRIDRQRPCTQGLLRVKGRAAAVHRERQQQQGRHLILRFAAPSI